MDTRLSCPVCGKPLAANAPKGLCPECLLKAAFPTGTEPSGKPGNFQPPRVSELHEKFPQLQVLELIGSGGMGAVYRARQKELDRIVALKVLPPDIGQDVAFTERFTREARALAKLNHPNIVTLYEFGKADGLYFFLMEFVDGVTLRRLLQAERVSPREALAIVPQICDALQYAHDQGIVHRDIKPENILLDRQGRVKVADFGLAKLIGTELELEEETTTETGSPALTEAGKVMGTPRYMAPEQLSHPAEVDHRADIYALGMVFYQMLTGELPEKRIEPPSSKVRIDVRLDDIVLRALEKEPKRRYQQVSVLKTDVESVATNPQMEQAGRVEHVVPPAPPLEWRDRWYWDPRVITARSLPLVVLTLLPLLASNWDERVFGMVAVGIPSAILAGIYSWTGFQIAQIRREVGSGKVELAEGWIVPGWGFSQGLLVLHADRLELIRVWYRRTIVIPLKDIISVQETRWVYMPLFWKHGFKLHLADGNCVSIAVPEPFGRRWRFLLSGGKLPELPSVAKHEGAPQGIPLPVEVTRWVARVLGTMLLAFYGFFILAEGLPAIGSAPGGVQLNFLALGLMLAGFALGWKSDGTAALLIASGWTLWHASEGRIGLNFFQTPLPIAALYAFCWWFKSRRTGVLISCVVCLSFCFAIGRLLLPANVFVLGRITDALTQKPLANAELRVLPRSSRVREKSDRPNARTDNDGRFTLYLGWFSPTQKVVISSPGHALLTTQLGTRDFGKRRINRDFQLEPIVQPNHDGAPPVVVRTAPESGLADVDANLTELRVTFSKRMEAGSWSWVKSSDSTFPEMTGQPHFLEDGKTCVLPVKLQPGRVYALWLNVDNFQDFRSENGQPAVPYLLIFKTENNNAKGIP